jgi:hypothetical protein
VVVEYGPQQIVVLVRGRWLEPKETCTRDEIQDAMNRVIASIRR